MTHKGGPCRDKAKTQGQGANQRARRAPMQLARPVFFIGFMGAGKTSVEIGRAHV